LKLALVLLLWEVGSRKATFTVLREQCSDLRIQAIILVIDPRRQLLESTVSSSLLAKEMTDVFLRDTNVTERRPTIDGAFCAFDFTNRAEHITNVDIGDTGGKDQLTLSECLSVIS
jgi:hypothetical protein